jgi:hypothetical protein
MSRAFVKEDGPQRADLPDLPVSPHPNHVTRRGLADLRARLAARQADLARALIGARAGDVVRWPRPGGALDLEVLEIGPWT